MPNPFSYEAQAAMFFAGFVMLTPHRIAILCANHVIKRFHLPPDVVPLFIYKIHNPMELSSFASTLLVNLITWMNDATFKAIAIKRVLSILGVWSMFISSVISYILFISGGDYGYFDKFYWSVVYMTFANGFYSNLSFGVNFNTSLYGAGMPSSGFVTFFMHYIYKGLYTIHYWEDYDYTLVIVQYWFSMITLLATAILWTTDQVIQMSDGRLDDIRSEHGTESSVNIHIDKTGLGYNPSNGNDIYDLNQIADGNVKVFLKFNEPNIGYTCYKHKVQGANNNYKKIGTASFKNKNADLNKDVGGTIQESNVHYVNVYYLGDRPMVICVEKDKSGVTGQKEYQYFKTDTVFSNPFNDTNKWKDITKIENLNQAQAGKIRNNQDPDTSGDLKLELLRLTLVLILVCIAIMMSIIFVSVMIGFITYKKSKLFGIFIGLTVYTVVTIVLSGDGNIVKLFTEPEQWSPILMLAFSLGTVYAFYPSISPYALVDPDSGKTIDLWIVFTSALPTYAIAVMDTVKDAKGPGGVPEFGGKNWKIGGDLYWWHYQWLFAIPYILCIHVFISTLHFPQGLIGRYVKDNFWVAGIIGVTFNFVQEWLEAIGFGGGGKQGDKFNGAVSQFNGLFFLTVMAITMFTKDYTNPYIKL